MFSLDENILINQWVQGHKDTADLLDWYRRSPERDQDIRHYLVSLCQHARASGDDGVSAVRASGIKPGRTVCALLSMGARDETFRKLVALRQEDGEDVFILLLHLLRIADRRRYEHEEPNACTHWWHRDLGDPAVLRAIRKEYEEGKL